MNGNIFNKEISEKAELILSYLNGEITPEEENRLKQWLSESQENELLFQSIRHDYQTQTDILFFSSIDVQQSLDTVKERTGQSGKALLKPYSKFLKAACLIILISSAVGSYISLKEPQPDLAKKTILPPVKVDPVIKPGGNVAKLELANGSMLALENLDNTVILDKGVRIARKQGVIYYTISTKGSDDQISYNRITTPKGGKYEIVLSDGTHVWLNSESSLRFPISNSSSERIVELSGEAYFEVTKMPHKPFKVRVKDVTVEALGTSFNILSYKSEDLVKTTLVEGSIKVSKGKLTKFVVPGQQIEAKETLKIVDDSNIQKAIAWKSDLFEFENDELKEIFPQLERWYDVDITYSETVASKRFTGSLSRKTDIKVVLEMLKEAGIKYQAEERRIFFY